MNILRNVSLWPTVDRAVFMTDDGKGSVIVEKERNKAPWLSSLHVDDDSRKKGYATALMDAAESWCREMDWGCVTLGWWAAEAPDWVCEWYGRRGYKETLIGSYSCIMEKILI